MEAQIGVLGKELEESDSLISDYSQNSMVLAQKQKCRSLEQYRKPRDKPMHLWSPNLWQKRQEYTMERRQSLQEAVLDSDI